MRPSIFGCSPGTYGDRLWTTELQKRLMIRDPGIDLITVGDAALRWKPALHLARISRGGRQRPPAQHRRDLLTVQVTRLRFPSGCPTRPRDLAGSGRSRSPA